MISLKSFSLRDIFHFCFYICVLWNDKFQGMGIGGPNGQMSGPIGGMSHLPPGNMMQSYQGWGTPPASTGYPGF